MANSAFSAFGSGVLSVSGTSNQITASTSDGVVTLSTPQNIHTSATPQFSRIGLNKASTTGIAIDALNVSGGQGFRIENPTSSDIGFSTYVTGDDFVRFTFLGSGFMEWGSGSLVADTNLYRSASNTLKTDDSFVIGASLSLPIATVSATTTLDDSRYTVLCDATSAGFTVNLPAASGASGRVYCVKKVDSTGNVVTIDGNASETIDGATTKTLSTQYASATLHCDGNAWYVM